MKAYCVISGVLFAIVAIAHVARLILQLPVHIGAADIPMWVSWGGIAVPGGLSIWGFSSARGR